MPAAPPTPPVTQTKPRWRHWLRRLMLWGLGLLVTLAIFHRPILRYVISKVVTRQATAQNLQLAWLLDGSITSGVQISSVNVSGGAGHWLLKGEIGEISADYSLWRLIREGPADFLNSVKLHDAAVEVDFRNFPKPAKSEPTETKTGGPPELVWPKSIDLKNLSAKVTLKDGSTWIVENFTLQAGEGQPGAFSCQSIQRTPNGPEFANLSANVEIRDRRLAISHFELQEALIVEKLAADLSKLSSGEIHLDAAIHSGPAVATVSVDATLLGSESPVVDAELDFHGLTDKQIPNLPPALRFGPAAGKFSVRGPVLRPAELQGSIHASVTQTSWENILTESATLDAAFEGGRLLSNVKLTRGTNTLAITANADLPARWEGVAKLPWKATGEASIPKLADWIGQEIPVEMWIGLSASASGAGADYQQALARLELREVQHAEGFLPLITAEASATSTELMLKELVIPMGTTNQFRVSGSLELAGSQPFSAQWNLDCGSLPEAIQTVKRSDLPLAGSIDLNGDVAGNVSDLRAGVWQKLTGKVDLIAKELNYKGREIESIQVAASMAEETVHLPNASLRFNASNGLQASGQVELAAGLPLQAKLALDFQSLAEAASWGELANLTVPILGGSLKMDVSATGTAANLALSGEATIQAKNVIVKDVPEPISLTASLLGKNDSLHLTAAEAVMGSFTANLSGECSARQAKVNRLVIQDGGKTVLEGHATVPFAAISDTLSEESTDVIDARIQAQGLDLARYAGSKFSGKADLDLTLAGTINNPAIQLQAALRDARAAAAPSELEKGSADLRVILQDRQFTLDSEIRQFPLKPLKLTVQAKVDSASLRKDPLQFWNLPFKATVRLPESDLAPVAKYLQGVVQSIAGNLRLNADISGTVRQPQWNGQLMLVADSVVFNSPSLPGIQDGKVALDFKDTLLMPSISAILAGGKVNASGTVSLAEISQPVLNLKISATEALIMRSRDASLRANADVSMQGPLQSVRVTGLVEAVRGRIFKELEFIPLSLPDDLPPPPPSVHRSEPMRLTGLLADWNFDLALRTKDPIRLMGNVLNGGVTADLKLSGTGAAPNLTGKAIFDDAVLSLPFSRMKIIKGEAVIDPTKPMEPEISIQAESQVGEYSVTLYVYGSAFDPKTRFLSVPPLSEPDIAVLLATGAPLASNSTRAGAETAGRAAFLLLQDAYRKMFKKSGPRYEEPPRMHLSFNPSSGPLGIHGPAILADYDLTNNLRLSGSAAQSGNMRAMLQWIFRFGEPATPPASSTPPKR